MKRLITIFVIFALTIVNPYVYAEGGTAAAFGELQYASVLIGEQVFGCDDVITKSGFGTFSGILKSTNGVSRDIIPIIAWFDNNDVLISAQVCEKVTVTSVSSEYVIDVNIPKNLFDYRMVVFFWNEIGNTTPFSTPAEFIICNSEETSDYNYSDVYLSSRSYHTADESGGSTSDALKKFMATGCLWTYIHDNSSLQVIRDSGAKVQTSVTITVGNARTRALDFGGNYVVAPWLPSDYYWSCVNNSSYKTVLLERIDTEFQKGIRNVQFDDWAANAQLTLNGCFCSNCIEKFDEWLRKNLTTEELANWGITDDEFNFKTYIKSKYAITSLAQYKDLRENNTEFINNEFAKFGEFQRESVKKFHSSVSQYLKEKWGEDVQYMANVSSLSTVLKYQNDTFCYNVFDGGIGESDDSDLSFINVVTNSYLNKAIDYNFIYSPYPTNGMNDNIRKGVAYAYATGQHMLVPWDVHIGQGVGRYYGTKDECGEMFRFVREFPFLFDGMEENPEVGLLLDINNMGQTDVKNAVSKLVDRGIPFKMILSGDKHLNQTPEYVVKKLAGDDYEDYKNGDIPVAVLSSESGLEIGDDTYFNLSTGADGKYLHIINNADDTIEYKFPRTEKVTMEFDIYNPYADNTTNTLQFYLNDSEQSIISGVPVIVEKNRIIRYDSNAQAQWLGTPSKQKWDHIKVVADAKTNTFDIWVNNSVMTNQPTRKGNISAFDYLRITSKSGTNRYIDNLKITTSEFESDSEVIFIDDSSKAKISEDLISLMEENEKTVVYVTDTPSEEETKYFASKADKEKVHTLMREGKNGKVIHVLNENTSDLTNVKVYFSGEKISDTEVTVFAPGENPYKLTVNEENGLKYVTLPALSDWAVISSAEYTLDSRSFINLGTQYVPSDFAEISESGKITITTHGRGLGVKALGDEDGTQDRAGFVYKNVQGTSAYVSAKVLSENTPSGVMIRDDVSSNAVFAALEREGNKISLVYRNKDNGAVNRKTVMENCDSNFLGLEYDGQAVSVYIDGFFIETFDIAMENTVCGIYAYSDSKRAETASFENMKVQ